VSRPAATRWRVVGLAIGAGVLAGMQVGKVPPSIPALRASLDLGLVTAGWVASTFNVVGACAAVAGGLWADRIGARRALLAGLALLALGSLAGAAALGGATLIGSRALAGTGLIAVAVAAPRLIVSAAAPRDYGLALGAWGTYMPTGMALAMVLAGTLAAGWRALWLLNAALLLAFLVLFASLTRAPPDPSRPRRAAGRLGQVARLPGPWLLAACFGCYTVQWAAITTWLPTFLIETRGAASTGAGLVTAAVVATNVPGNLVGAWLLHRRVARWWLLLAAYAGMAASAYGVFAASVPALLKLPSAFAFSGIGGLLPAAVLGAGAAHAPSREALATVNGFMVQGSHLGILAGPPLLAVLLERLGGWEHAWLLMLAAGSLGATLAAALGHLERRTARAASP